MSQSLETHQDEKSKCLLGEQPEGRGVLLCFSNGVAQGDPDAPGVGAVPDLHRRAVPIPGIGGPDGY